MKKRITFLLVTSLLLTGCVDPTMFDAWDKEKAFLELPSELLGSVFWIVMICTLPPLFVAGLSGIFLIARQKVTQGLILLGFAIGMLMLTVAAPYIYLPFLEAAGKQVWPEGLTSEFIFGNLTGATAKAWAVTIPFLVAIWELALISQLLMFTTAATFTRSIKPLISLVASTVLWLLFYPLLYVQSFAAQKFFGANVVTEFISDAARIYDTVFLLMTIGDMLILFIIGPAVVFVLLLFIPFGEVDGEGSTIIPIPIPILVGGRSNGRYQGDGDVIYGNPPSRPLLPTPRDSGDFGGGSGLPVMDGVITSEEGVDEEPLPNRARDEHGSIITPPPADSTRSNGKDQREEALPNTRNLKGTINTVGILTGHPEVTLITEAAGVVEESLPDRKRNEGSK